MVLERTFEARCNDVSCCKVLYCSGIRPDSLLKGALKLANEVKHDTDGGKDPDNWLFPTWICLSNTSVLICWGIGPKKWLELNCNAVRLTSIEREGGMLPVRKLLLMWSVCRLVSCEIRAGMGPIKFIWYKAMLLSEVRLKSRGSKVPEVGTLASDRDTIWRCELQRIPVILHAACREEVDHDASWIGEPQCLYTLLRVWVSLSADAAVGTDANRQGETGGLGVK